MMGPPYGVVGPYSAQNNIKILNHDFTHRTHMEIFHGNYYPPALSDWWMDDWISMTYGDKRTRQSKSIEILHHVTTHGQRYGVDFSHSDLLQGLIHQGKQTILDWMQDNGLPIETIDAFNHSRFDDFPLQDL